MKDDDDLHEKLKNDVLKWEKKIGKAGDAKAKESQRKTATASPPAEEKVASASNG